MDKSALSIHMQHSGFNMSQIKSIINILASLVTTKDTTKGKNNLQMAILSVMPALLITLSDRARVHSELPIIKRAARQMLAQQVQTLLMVY